MILRLLASRRRNEGGSVMIAVIVVGVVGLLVATTLDTVTGGLNLTRGDQNRINAFQFANAGVDKAVYRIDRNVLPASDPASPTYTPTFDADGNVIAFTERLDVGPSSYEVTVAQDPPGQTTRWRVTSLGTDKPTGKQRQAIATIAARPLFENGFFTVENFYLTGNQTTPLAYDSEVCPTASGAHPSCSMDPVPGGLGTNAKVIGSDMTTKAFVEKWREFNMYGRATQAAAEGDCGIPSANSDPSQARCAAHGGVVNPVTDQLEYPLPPPPPGTQSCPNGGNVGADGVPTTVAPGDYTCEHLTFRGNIVISPAGTVRFWPTKTFVVAAGAVVNREVPTKRFQVYFPEQSGGGSSGSICDAEIWGLLFTPGLEIDCTGGHQPEMYGAVIANLHGGTGNHFKFHWDIAALHAVNDGKYVVRNWRECPVGTADC